MDEEEDRARPEAARRLDGLSVDELRRLRAELEGEIARIDRELAMRNDVRSAAEALFRRPDPAPGEDR